jgi:hypothetical protein
MSTSPGCIMTTNTDISGIGTRVSIYLQALMDLTLTVIAFKPEHLGIAVRTSLITATALIVSAFVQHHSAYGLSLFDAIIIGQLITIKIAGILRYPQSISTYISFAVFVSMTVSFQFWVWSHVDTFGSQPLCNDFTVFVFFGHSVRATVTWLKIITIIAASFAAVAALQSVFMLIHIMLTLKEYLKRNKEANEVSLGPVNFGQLGTIIYLIVTTEQIVDRNNVPESASQWSFGQTLSMLLVIPSFVEILERIAEIVRSVSE